MVLVVLHGHHANRPASGFKRYSQPGSRIGSDQPDFSPCFEFGERILGQQKRFARSEYIGCDAVLEPGWRCRRIILIDGVNLLEQSCSFLMEDNKEIFRIDDFGDGMMDKRQQFLKVLCIGKALHNFQKRLTFYFSLLAFRNVCHREKQMIFVL